MSEVARLNLQELDSGVPDSGSWHQDFRDSAWVFVGNLAQDLVEGDVLCVFSQFGEIDDLIFPRDDRTGRPKGFCFIKFEDWRSTVLSVDNFNGAELLGRILKVDHHRPQERINAKTNKTIEEQLQAAQPGSAFSQVEGPHDLFNGVNLFARKSASTSAPVDDWRAEQHEDERERKEKKPKKHDEKKHRKKESKKRQRHDSD